MDRSPLDRLMPELMFVIFDNLRGTNAFGNLRSTCKSMFNLSEQYHREPFVPAILSMPCNQTRKSELLCKAVQQGSIDIVVDIVSSTYIDVEAFESASITAISYKHHHILSYLITVCPDLLHQSSQLLDIAILNDSVEAFDMIKKRIMAPSDTLVWRLLSHTAPHILRHELRHIQGDYLVTIITDVCLLAQKGKCDKLQKLGDEMRRISPHHQDIAVKVLRECTNDTSVQLCFNSLIDESTVPCASRVIMTRNIGYTRHTMRSIQKACQLPIAPGSMCDAWLNWDAKAFGALYEVSKESHNQSWLTELLNLVIQYDSTRRAKTFIEDLVTARGAKFLPDALVKVASRQTQTSTIEAMLLHGADASWNNNEPILMACKGMYAESAKVFDLLTLHGAIVPESLWRMCLSDAIMTSRIDIVKRLLVNKTHVERIEAVMAHVQQHYTCKKIKDKLIRICARPLNF